MKGFTAMPKKTKAQELALKYMSDYKKMSPEALIKTLGTFKNAYASRKRVLEQSGKTSSALKNIEKKNPFTESISKLRKEYKGKGKELKERVLTEIKKYKDFFSSKTSAPTKKTQPKKSSTPIQSTKSEKKKASAHTSIRKSKETKAEKIAKKPIEEFAKFKTTESDLKQMEKEFRTLQQGYIKRAKQFEDKGIYSSAVVGMKEFSDPYLDSIAELRKQYEGRPSAWRNRMLSEIAIFHNFFNNKTSTLKGAYEATREQDARLFGKDEKGNPIRTMTEEERSSYWRVYNEYLRLHENRMLASNQVQQVVSRFFINGELPIWNSMEDENFDLVALLEKIEEQMQKEYIDDLEEEEKRFGSGESLYSEDWYD